jgi:hypothetical protein
MTLTQRNIIAVLVLINIIVFGLACLFVFGVFLPQQARISAQSTAVAFQQTEASYSPTPSPTNTATPTITSTPSRTPTPTLTPRPTNTLPPPPPTPIDPYVQLQNWWNDYNGNKITRMQLDAYFRTVIGKKVHWVSEVLSVSSDGEVGLWVNRNQCFGCVVGLQNVPREKAMALKPHQMIEFDGIIIEAEAGAFSFSCNIKWLAFTQR